LAVAIDPPKAQIGTETLFLLSGYTQFLFLHVPILAPLLEKRSKLTFPFQLLCIQPLSPSDPDKREPILLDKSSKRSI
jgi:hypothetical protein